jgi:acetyltransferase-like isoleucine patch superfamily enzyme
MRDLRSFAGRVVRKLRGPAPTPSPAPSPTPPAGKPFAELKASGLRIEKGLRLFTKKNPVIRFEPPAQLNNADLHLYRGFELGRYTFIRSGTIRHVTRIGRYTSIGPRVMIGEGEHPIHWLSTTPAQYLTEQFGFYPPEADAEERVILRDDSNTDASARGFVEIGNDVWIGANVMIRRGVRIGDGAVVASGAFVNRDVEPYSIVGGLPAKPIKNRFDDETVARLLALKWWEFDITDLAGVDFTDVAAAIREIEAREAAGTITRVEPTYSQVTLTRSGYTGLKVHKVHREAAARRLDRRSGEVR